MRVKDIMDRRVKNGVLKMETGEMDYIRFGRGKRTLIVLPGVGDGIRTIKGTAQLFNLMFHSITKEYTVYSFSRRLNLPRHMSTRRMADDLSLAMKSLGINKASIAGISQGGMIAQWMAIDHPEMVENLVLAVTTCRPNKTLKLVSEKWVDLAKRGEYQKLMICNSDLSYCGFRKELYRIKYSMMGNIGRPKSFDRFLTEVESCLTHNTLDQLDKITCPTLIIGGRKDRILTGEASVELFTKIRGSSIYMYETLGHGLYEEASDFHKRVARFCARTGK